MCRVMKACLSAFVFTMTLSVFAIQPIKVVKPLRITFYIDDFNAEFSENYTDSFKTAITQSLAINIYQKASDIIFLTDGILKNFLARTGTINAGFYAAKFAEEKDFFASIKFNFNDWTFYKIKDSNFYVIILTDRLKNLKDSGNFKIDEWEVFSKEATVNFLSQKNTEISRLNTLKNIFSEGKDRVELMPMNIIFDGHGNLGQSIAGMGSSAMNDVFNFLNNLNVNSVLVFSCSSGGKNLDFMQFRKDLDDQNISMNLNYILIVSAVSDSSIISTFPDKLDENVQLDPSVNIKEYFDAWEKARSVPKDKNIKTTKVESDFLQNILKNLNLTKYWFLNEFGFNSIPQVLIPKVGWFQYFDIDPDIQKISDATISKQLVEREKDKVKVIQKLALLLYSEAVPVELEFTPKKFVINKNNISLNAKVIPVPEWLKAWNLFFPTADLITYQDYSGYVFKSFFGLYGQLDSLYFFPSIISMQRGDALHLLSKITVQKPDDHKAVGILSFIRSAFLNLQGRETEKTFFIKELNGYNDIFDVLYINKQFPDELAAMIGKDIKLDNVFIKTKETVEKNYEPTWFVQIMFQLNDKYYMFFNDKLHNPYKKTFVYSSPVWSFKTITVQDFNSELEKNGLGRFVSLCLPDYIKRISELKDLYKSGIKQVLRDGQTIVPERLSFKDFLIKLDIDKFEKYLTSGQGIVTVNSDLSGNNLSVFLKKLKSSLGNLEVKLNSLKQKLTAVKVHLSGNIAEPEVMISVEEQKKVILSLFATVDKIAKEKLSTEELKTFAEGLELVNNRIKDDIANKLLKQKLTSNNPEKFSPEKLKIELINSINLNAVELSQKNKLNLSYILIFLINKFYFRTVGFVRLTDKSNSKEFTASSNLAGLILENAFKVMMNINAINDSNFYLPSGNFYSGRNETNEILNKLLDIIVIAAQNTISVDSSKSVNLGCILALNDLIKSLNSDGLVISDNLKKLNDKIKSADINFKILIGHMLASKLTDASAKVVLEEIFKLLELTTQDQQSIFRNSQCWDLYGLGVAVVLKFINVIDGDRQSYLGSRLIYELKTNVDYSNELKQYFYFSVAQFLTRSFDWESIVKAEKTIKSILDITNINRLYIFDIVFNLVIYNHNIWDRYKTSDLKNDIQLGEFHKNLEVKEFDSESFMLKSGGRYFYKDLNSLNFAFNLVSYFIKTEFNSAFSLEWIINFLTNVDYLSSSYSEEPKKIIKDGNSEYLKSLNQLLEKK